MYGQRKRGGVRRHDAARKSGTPTTPTGAGRQKQLSSAAVVRKARKMSSGEGSRGISYANPFHKASSRLHQHATRSAAQHSLSAAAVTTTSSSKIMTSSLPNEGGPTASGNPFFAQLAKKDNPAAPSNPAQGFPPPPPPPQFPPTQPVPHPPSYASVLTGKGTSLQGLVPSFAARSPGSVQHALLGSGAFGRPPAGHTHQLAAGYTHQLAAGHAQQLPGDPPKTLHLKNLPDHLNNPSTLTEHFSKFGQITVLNCQPVKRYATVGFATREAAVKAKRSGRLLSEEPIQIFWHSGRQQTHRSEPHDPRLTASGMEQGHTLPPPPPPYVSQLQPSFEFAPSQTRFETGLADHQTGFQHHHHEGDPILSRPGDDQAREGRLVGFTKPENEANDEEIRSRKILQTTRKRLSGVPQRPTAIAVKRQRASDGREEMTAIEEDVREVSSIPVLSGVVGGRKSVWDRLGGREGESEDGGGGRGGGSEDGGGANTAKRKTKVGGQEEKDEEWTPQQTDEGEVEEEEEEERGDEGVAEGRDSVLTTEASLQSTDEMDTIARTADHSYYLRSLHKPEMTAGLRGPKSILQVPRPSSEESGSVSKATDKPHPLHKVGVTPRTYGPLPIPILPPPPMPRGQSAADKYQSLDARDEDIRKNLVKQTSLTTAEVVVGTCPDMCPEKERYMREDRRRLSWFEIVHPISDAGAPRVDHQRAVKEYNRSAADKAEDLRHELRPEPVLLMTMDYLMTSVMDEGEEARVELWYDFVWNRTRAIRKDITLQHLCSQGCVELTEKCARFHILCAYLLCEEDMAVFDQKMNHENLTKCLITLKQFYWDLRIEQNVVCPNEAEFCCYDILLHLTDGNVLNTVEQYSPAVRQDPIVRLAVDIALTFSSNTYTTFFKLVRSPACSFLCACIIHRYFIEMRTTALQVMVKAYTHSKPTHFPLAKFTELLGFENEAEATEFCVRFDLTVTKKMVKLSRDISQQPSSPSPLRLSPSLAGAKRANRRLGEIMNGKPLPLPPKLPRPYDSFAPGTPLAPPTPVLTAPPQLGYSDQELLVAIDIFLEEVVNDEVPSVAMEILQNEQDEAAKQVSMCDFCEGVMSECVREECARVAMATLADVHSEWQRQEQARILEEVGKVIAMEIEHGLIMERVSQISMQVLSETHEEFAAVVMYICDEVMCESVRSLSGEVGEEVVREAEAIRQEKLEKLEKQVLRKRLRRHWKLWRQRFKTRCHTRECVSAIPSLPPLLPPSAQLSARQLLGDTVTSRNSLDTDGENVSDLLERERNDLEDKWKKFLSPLDLPDILCDSLLISRPPSLPPLSHSHHIPLHLYWSLAILHTTDSTHSRREDDHAHSRREDAKLLEYLERKLQFCPPGAESLGGQTTSEHPGGLTRPKSLGGTKSSRVGVREISISSTPLMSSVANKQVKIVVKSVQLRQSLRSDLLGVCAAMFVVPTPRGYQTPEAYRDDVVRKLMLVTQEGWWAETHVPMLVLAPFHAEDTWLAHWNTLRFALEALPAMPGSFLSDVNFSTLQTDVYTPQQEDKVCEGLKWLATHSPRQPPLSSISVRDFIEEGVLQHFVPLVSSDRETRKKNGLGSQPLHHLISLYNAIITHLAKSAATRRDVSWPVREFAPSQFGTTAAPDIFNHEGLPALEWSDDRYQSELQECILRYRLVPFDEAPPTPHTSWAEACHACLQYIGGFTGSKHQPLMSRVKALLHSYSSHMTSDQSELMFPWDHVITTCINHLISIAPADVWVTCFHGSSKNFTTPSAWRMAEASTSLECAHSMTFELRSPRPKRHRRNLSDSYLFPPHSLHTTHSQVTPSQLPLATKLAEKIDNEKRLSIDFEKQLERLLSDTSSPPPLLPPPPPHAGHTPSSTSQWAGSLELGVRLLKMKIKTSRFQDKVDQHALERLTQTHNFEFPSS